MSGLFLRFSNTSLCLPPTLPEDRLKVCILICSDASYFLVWIMMIRIHPYTDVTVNCLLSGLPGGIIFSLNPFCLSIFVFFRIKLLIYQDLTLLTTPADRSYTNMRPREVSEGGILSRSLLYVKIFRIQTK